MKSFSTLKGFKGFLVLLTLMLFAGTVRADYITNLPTKVTDADGIEHELLSSGDEYFSYLHDSNGFTIIQGQDGYFYYAMKHEGELIPSAHRIQTVNPLRVGIEPYLTISQESYQKRVDDFWRGAEDRGGRAPHSGTLNNLVVYIRFADDTEFTVPRSTYDALFNPEGAISMKSYFQEVSYGLLNIESYHYPLAEMNTNLSYQDSQPRNYYRPYNATTNPIGYQGGNNSVDRRTREHTLLQNAINFVKTQIPADMVIDTDGDGLVDNVCFIVRGNAEGWSDLLWAHRWVLYTYDVRIHGKRVYDYTFQPENQSVVKTLCHEMFHTLGAPDLYRYVNNNIEPVGSWDLMHSGFGHMGAYMKWKYANQTWISNIPVISDPGRYTLNPLSSPVNNAFRINSPNSTSEYFVVEYRKKEGRYESYVPASGLLVYRINTAAGNGNAQGPPDEVYLYRPGGVNNNTNGTVSLANYSANSGRTAINDQTSPSSFLSNDAAGGLDISNVSIAGNTITFDLFGGPQDDSDPYNFNATAISGSQINLSWNKNSQNHDVLVAFSTDAVFGTPTGTYAPGQQIQGGGTIVYFGDLTTASHTGLNPSTIYHYKAWSYNGEGYSTGIPTNATTLCGSLILPVAESFSGSSLPLCWSQENPGSSNLWSRSTTSQAGGTSPELRLQYISGFSNHSTRFVTPPINTIGYTSLTLSFRHFLDAYASGVSFKVQTSNDGIDWVDTNWGFDAGNQNVGPELVQTTLTNHLNSETTFIAFTATGNLYQFDYWYIDDISIDGVLMYLPPQNLTALVNGQNVELSWTAPANGGGTDDPVLSGYQIFRNQNLIQSILNPLTVTFTDVDVSTGIYTYYIKATYENPEGISIPGNSAQVSVGNPQLAISPAFQTVSSYSAGLEYEITSNAAWTLSSNQSWISFDPVTGEGDAVLTVIVAENNTNNSRSALITAQGAGLFATASLVQAPAEILSISPSSRNVSSVAGNTSFNITSNRDWNVETSADWITVNTPTGEGEGIVSLSYAANTSFEARTAQVIVSGEQMTTEFTLNQFAALTVSPLVRNVGANQGTTIFLVYSSVSWSAQVESDWLSLSTTSGSSNATITASFNQNTSLEARSAVITFTSGDFSLQATVNQAAASPYIQVSPSQIQNITHQAGNLTFDVQSNTQWSVGSSENWLVPSQTQGEGASSITAVYSENTSGTIRSASLTFSIGTSEVVVLVNQDLNTYAANVYNKNIRVYPNPTEHVLNVGGIDEGLLRVKLSSIQGVELFEARPENLADQTLRIDTRAFARGIYVLHLEWKDQIKTFRVVLK